LLASTAAIITCFSFLERFDAVCGSALAVVVLVIAAVDVQRFEIPDLANLTMALLGIAWEARGWNTDAVMMAVLRSTAAAAIFLFVRESYRRLRQIEGLGLGDVKLAAAGAIWLSWSEMWAALLVAVGGAALVVVGRRVALRESIAHNTALPFGAFLAPAIWIVWMGQLNVS
jgi:leader peptidase (prepilin peptidase)/N-methyltransferase